MLTVLILSGLVILEVLIIDEQMDYFAFREEVRPEWDCLRCAVCIQSFSLYYRLKSVKLIC